jgi:lysophospholipase L1-like esterase
MPQNWDDRLMFFRQVNGGKVFQTKPWGGFVFQPNAEIRTAAYFITAKTPIRLTEEYEYGFATNSDGLVQNNEISPTARSVMLLGDSFTQGQGARPWFYDLERAWTAPNGYRLINGGIMATGVVGWERLYSEIATKANVDKVVLIFISDDWARGILRLSDATLICIETPADCTGREDFYGLPAELAAAADHIHRMAQIRSAMPHRAGSELYRQIVNPVRNMLFGPPNFRKNVAALQSIVAKVRRSNILLIHLPQKDEIGRGPNLFGVRARELISQQSLAFADGFNACGLTAADYYVNDGHPNANGYAKIGACVKDALNRWLGD